MVHSTERKTNKLPASYNCHYHLFTGTGHGILSHKLQAEEWWLLAGFPYGSWVTVATTKKEHEIVPLISPKHD